MSGVSQLFLCGHQGRMGQSIIELLPNFKMFVGPKIFDPKESAAAKGSVLIDFSSPEGFRECLLWCQEKAIAFVSGTTGLGEQDFDLLNNASESIPVLWAPNMSMGVQWMKSALSTLSTLADEYDFQIEEIHHNKKKDAPSGTAIDLHQALDKALKKQTPAPLSIRGGGVFGVHRLFVMGEEETITIEHQALDRKVFARGALKAAAFLKDQKAGRYTMQDVLGF